MLKVGKHVRYAVAAAVAGRPLLRPLPSGRAGYGGNGAARRQGVARREGGGEFRLLAPGTGVFPGAVRFFTRLPVPAWVGYSPAALNQAARYFPAVGLVVGLIGGLVYALATPSGPRRWRCCFPWQPPWYATGAFHEDGPSDAVDGLGGGWEKGASWKS